MLVPTKPETHAVFAVESPTPEHLVEGKQRRIGWHTRRGNEPSDGHSEEGDNHSNCRALYKLPKPCSLSSHALPVTTTKGKEMSTAFTTVVLHVL